jgi:hypothetical protein
LAFVFLSFYRLYCQTHNYCFSTNPFPFHSVFSHRHVAFSFSTSFPRADNAGVVVNPKGETKGSAITGPVAKEAADLWPRVAATAGSIL